MAVSSSLSVSIFKVLPWRSMRPSKVFITTTTTTTTATTTITLHTPNPRCNNTALSFCSNSTEPADLCPQHSSKQSPLIPGLYLVGTPIGNLEDITLRALRVLRSADVILSEDTRHSGKLLQHYNIKTPLLSYHKFNESQREQAVLKRLQQGEIVAQICDAGTPGISDPGMELVKLCVDENIPVIPIPGPSAFVAALFASGLATDEFTFVRFLPKHAGSRKERLIVSAKEVATQIFYVPPHKLHQFIEEASSIFGDCRQCAMAREMTKIHEEFWCGTLEEAKGAFLTRQPKGEITFLIEGKANCVVEALSESQLEKELRELISGGQCLSSVKLEGDIDQGVEYYKKALYYNWHYADAMYNLGVAYGEMLKFDMAIVFYELAFHFNPHCAEACNNLGVIYKDRDNLDKAVECYQLALSIKPNFSQSLNNLGVVYTVQGKMDAAASMIEKAIVANPTYAEAYNNLELKDARIPYRDSPELLELLLEFSSSIPSLFDKWKPTFLDMYVKSVLNAKEKPAMGLSEAFLPLFTYLSHEDFKSIVVPSSVKSKFASRASILCAAAEFYWAAAAAAMLL